MIIVNAIFQRQWRYAVSRDEISALIDDVLKNLKSERLDLGYLSPGDSAVFMISDRYHTGDTELPNNFLQVSLNRSSGYGGLMWYVDDKHPMRGGIFDSPWLSDNPHPPSFDPRVVANPGEPNFYDPRSTLPESDVRAALEEFCRNGNGYRPECIKWTEGDLNGRRRDAV
ncbi:Imm1 family immunity protein [Spirillospora sp. NPDC049652]